MTHVKRRKHQCSSIAHNGGSQPWSRYKCISEKQHRARKTIDKCSALTQRSSCEHMHVVNSESFTIEHWSFQVLTLSARSPTLVCIRYCPPLRRPTTASRWQVLSQVNRWRMSPLGFPSVRRTCYHILTLDRFFGSLLFASILLLLAGLGLDARCVYNLAVPSKIVAV